MRSYLQEGDVTNQDITTKIAMGMFRAAKRNYARLFEAAQEEWERCYAGPDPSDACVSVRITAGKQPALASASETGREQLFLEEKSSFASAAV
jgi:hypothetical protein